MSINIEKKFKVTMSLHQKYFMLRLAEGLVKRDNLDIIYSPYPKHMLSSSYAIPNKNLRSFRTIGALRYLLIKSGARDLDRKIVFLFDKLVSLSLKKAPINGIFEGLNLSCEYSLKQAKKLGFLTFVERSCPHVDFQDKLLSEEYHRLLGVWPKPEKEEKRARMSREYDLADYIIVPSKYSFKSFIDKGFSPKKVLVVPLIYEKLIPSSYKRNKSIDKLKILCVGGNFYRKGIFYLLKAWEMLNLKDAELLIKGNIPKEFLNLLNIENVTLINKHLSDEEMIKLYQTAHIFVLPSIDDGFGMAAAEAMACGLPVIVTENVGIADGVEDYKNGFVIPIRNTELLAGRIRFFYDNSQKIAEMGKNAFEQSLFYKPENYVERMIRKYQSVF